MKKFILIVAMLFSFNVQAMNVKKVATCIALTGAVTNPATVNAGPISATVCGVGCGIIMECGCVSIGFILAPLVSPPAAAMIAASCGVLQTAGSIPSCVLMCLAIPSP